MPPHPMTNFDITDIEKNPDLMVFIKEVIYLK